MDGGGHLPNDRVKILSGDKYIINELGSRDKKQFL